MSKTKKSKLLASMLCATVVAGLYAGPVMAADTGLTVDGNKVVAEDIVIINGVKFVPNGSYADQGITADYRGHISINGLTISNAGAIDMKGESINNVGTFTAGNSGNNFKLTSQGVEFLVGQQDVSDKFMVKSYAGGNTNGGSAYIKTQDGEVVLAQSNDNKSFNNKLVVGKDGITVDGTFIVNGVEFSGSTPGEVPEQGIGADKDGNTTVNGVVIKTVDKNTLSRANDKDIVISAEGADDVNISAINRNVASISRDEVNGATYIKEGNAQLRVRDGSVTNTISTVNNKDSRYKKTNTSVSQVTNNGIMDSYTQKVEVKDTDGDLTGEVTGVTNTVETNANGTTFTSKDLATGVETSTIIKGDSITTGIVTASKDVVANGTSLVKVGTDLKAAQEDIIANTGKINDVETAYKAADEELGGKITANTNEISRVEADYKAADTAINARIDGLSGVADGLTGRVEAVENKTGGIERTTKFEDNTWLGTGTKTTTSNTDIENGAISVTQKTDEVYFADSKVGETTTTTVNVADGALKIENNDKLGTTASIADGTVTITGTEIGGTGLGLMNVNGAMNVNGVATFNGGTITNGGSVTNGLAVFNGGLAVKGVAGMSVEGGLKVDGGMHLNGIQYVNGDVVVNDSEGNELYSLKNIGYNTQDIKYANGVTTVSGVEFKEGTINANSLNLAGLDQDVATEINDLKDGFGNIDTDLGALTDRVVNVEDKTQNIRRIGNATIFSERVGINDRGLSIAADNGDTAIDITKEGNITAVGDIKGDNVYSANYDLETVGYNTQAISYENGVTTVSGVNFANGAITADTLNLAGLDQDVAAEINDLKDNMDTVGGDVSDLRNDVAQNTNDIGLLRTDVGVLRTDVNTLRVDVDRLNKRLEVVEDKTQNINTDNTYGPGEQPSGSGDVHEDGNTDFTGNINSDSITTGEITADKGTIGGVTMEDGKLTADEATIGDVTVGGSLNVADKVTVDKDGVTVKGDGENSVKIDGNDVSVSWKDDEGNSHETSIRDNYEAINDLDNRVTSEVNRLDNRISKVEDRIDKVGAMSAAIANLRTMGYDPTAPTEIAVGIGQYRSETGAALGLFHYPNKDFMLSLSVSTSGDEVMGGIGATWKFGRKTPEQMLAAEKEKAAKAKLAKAEAMKKAAAEAKVAAQQAKHAKMAAEKAAK